MSRKIRNIIKNNRLYYLSNMGISAADPRLIKLYVEIFNEIISLGYFKSDLFSKFNGADRIHEVDFYPWEEEASRKFNDIFKRPSYVLKYRIPSGALGDDSKFINIFTNNATVAYSNADNNNSTYRIDIGLSNALMKVMKSRVKGKRWQKN